MLRARNKNVIARRPSGRRSDLRPEIASTSLETLSRNDGPFKVLLGALRQGLLFLMGSAVIGFSSLPETWADYDLKEMTPAVQKAIESRQDRYPELQQWKIQGAVGEDNQGFVTALKAASQVEALVEAENQDRQVIYRAIVDQNGLGPNGPAQVQNVFAEVQRGKASPGEFIQLRSGEWVQK